MQLILEKEPGIDIKSNMSTLEDVLDKQISINSIIENAVQDVNMSNKENINKSVNLIDIDHENNKTCFIKCAEEESLDDSSVDMNKIENKECNTFIIEKELVMESPEVITAIENKDDNVNIIGEKYVENNSDKLVESNADTHNHNVDEPGNEHVDMSNNEIIVNNQDQNPEDKLIQIKKEINDILKAEVLNLDKGDINAQSEVESNTEMKEGGIDHCHIENDAKRDPVVCQKDEDVHNIISTENKNEDILDALTIKTPVNVNVDEIVNFKLRHLLQPVADEVNPIKNKKNDTKIHTTNSDIVEKLTDESLENECIALSISADKEIKETVPSDTETAIVTEYGSNDDTENSKSEAMDVEFIEDDNDKNIQEVMNVDKVIHSNSSESAIESLYDSSSSNNAIDCDDVTEVISNVATNDEISLNSEVMVVDEDKDVGIVTAINQDKEPKIQIDKNSAKSPLRIVPICRLSNTLDILSDDEDERPETNSETEPSKESETDSIKLLETKKQSINVEDDDDIMVIEEDVGNKTETDSSKVECSGSDIHSQKTVHASEKEVEETKSNFMESIELSSVKNSKEPTSLSPDQVSEAKDKTEAQEQISNTTEPKKPLIADGFLNSTKKRLADMTREELEEFCVLKIVESIVDRSNLSEIKLKLKTMAQSFEEYSKKAMVLYKQNRDLQVVLKSIQEEQKKTPNAITPLKITRSVGMQVLMIEKSVRKKGSTATSQPGNNKTRSPLSNSPRPHKAANNNNIPVPRLIPANNATNVKGPVPVANPIVGKQVIPVVNGLKTGLPGQKLPEKRPLHKSQSSDCVDLTDDEPPAKMTPRSQTAPVRLVPPQNLLAPQRAQFGQVLNNSRKVYIPISSPQGPNIRPGQTFMVKAAGPRHRGPSAILPRMPQNLTRQSRPTQGQGIRHPAPLPDAMKQYQPPNWKALPPAPDLKLSKVENGIVISWKIEGYQEDSYEDIASYQLYAYQETSAPPSTALWKKIGDVKALPLPMACTLTQFMSGFKYFFAVRAVDVRSRLGPFSLPGSILLLNKM